MDELKFEFHRTRYAALYTRGNRGAHEYFMQEALRDHVRDVQDALRKLQLSTLIASQHLREKQSVYYVQHGVGRRCGLLLSAFEDIHQTVPIGREEPLAMDDVKTICRDLNTIYINVVGLIDNLAWCLLFERGSANLKGLPDGRVGLFTKEFQQAPCFAGLQPRLAPFMDWMTDLRGRRNPAAHRIPLSVPPAILDPEAGARYQELEQQIMAAYRAHKSERADALLEEQQQLGRFYPRFLHDPNGPHYPFYPTIPEDLGMLVKVARVVYEFLDVER